MFPYGFFLISSCISFVKSQSHAFVQVDSELRYLVDGIHISMKDVLEVKDSEERPDGVYGDRLIAKNHLLFDPPFLGFNEHPTGIPKMKKVFVQNTSPDEVIHLDSLSGNTMHFHCTFFQDKVINPGGNTSFDVIFLGREEGFIENTIFVHTSVGTYRYWVKAIGTSNPYRIRPLIGIKMPLNSSFASPIQVHNPYSEDLKVVEMYSTGGDLHLELPDGVVEGGKSHWTIPPHQTKVLMKATFVARRENNHTAYIRIVPGKPLTDFLVIPVEVEVSSEQGLFFPSDSLYFGILTPHDPPVTLPLYLLNSAHKHIHIQNIITSTVNEAISIDFKPVRIPPGTVHPTQVATVTFNPGKVSSGEKVSGKLLIKSKISAYKLAVPFNVDLHQGELLYDSSLTRFYSGPGAAQLNEEFASLFSSNSHFSSSNSDTKGSYKSTVTLPRKTSKTSLEDESQAHDLFLKNVFKTPIIVFNVTLGQNATGHFLVKWNGPVVIEEGGKANIANLNLLSKGSNIHMRVDLSVHTNMTTIVIPLMVYNGKLTKFLPSNDAEEALDFGTLGMGEQHDNYFYLYNENPVNIHFKGWGSSLSHSAVELVGVVKGNVSLLSTHPNNTLPAKNLVLKPMHYAVFRIGVLAPDSEGIYVAEAFVRTQYQVIIIPFKLRTASGILTVIPNTISMENSFPGKISEQDIHVLSTFGHSMSVENIRPQVTDPRFTYIHPENGGPSSILHPGRQNPAGKIIFNPSAECEEECYTGFNLTSKVGQQWLNTLSLTPQSSELDAKLFNNFQERFNNLQSHIFNCSLLLDTSEVRKHRFNAKVSLIWPHLVPDHIHEFTLTPIKGASFINVNIHNPASQPVFIQVLFLHHYPMPESLQTVMNNQFSPKKFDWREILNGSSSHIFSLQLQEEKNICDSINVASDSICSSSPENILENNTDKLRKVLETNFQLRIAKDTTAFLLQPHAKVTLKIGFSPIEEKIYSSMIVLRNNLTAVESILLEGSGGRGHLSFEKINLKSMGLHFTIQDYPKNCTFTSTQVERQASLYAKHQSFLIKNDGELPIEISRFKIGDKFCQNYGFRIANCSGFTLRPNESKAIEVIFIPDYSLYHVEQHLTIETSLNAAGTIMDKQNAFFNPTDGHFYLQLIGTISPPIILKCNEQISRPGWEPLMYYSVVTILVAMFLGTVVRSFLEAEHTIRTSFVPMLTQLPYDQTLPKFDKTKVFDFKNIENSVNDKLYILNADTIKKADAAVYSKMNNYINHDLPKESYADKIKFSSNPVNNVSNKLEKSVLQSEKSKLNLKTSFPKNNMALSLSSLLPFTLRKNNKKPETCNNAVSVSNTAVNNVVSNASPTTNLNNKNNTRKESTPKDIISNFNYEFIENKMPQIENYLNNSETYSEDTSSTEDTAPPITYSKNIVIDEEKKWKKIPKQQSKELIAVNNNSSQRGSGSNADVGFEITTKCKRIKKIKEISGKKNGNPLELPYTLKPAPKMDSDYNENKASKKNRKKIFIHKENVSTPPPPLIKPKEPILPTPEPERRAPAKAIVAPRVQPQIQPLAPRDPSYSAVVLGNTKRTKPMPVGKIVPERKFVEKSHGIIGQRMSYPSLMSDLAPPTSPALKTCSISNQSLYPTAPSSSFDNMQNTSIGNIYSRPLTNPVGHVAAPPPPQAVSSHSWDPQTLSTPSRMPPFHHTANLGLDNLRRTTMTDDDWLPFDEPSLTSAWNTEPETTNPNTTTSFYEKQPPSPSLWESLSFSIWSSPWSNDIRVPKPNNYNLDNMPRSPWQDNTDTQTGAHRSKFSSPFSLNRYPDDIQDKH